MKQLQEMQSILNAIYLLYTTLKNEQVFDSTFHLPWTHSVKCWDFDEEPGISSCNPKDFIEEFHRMGPWQL